MLGDTLQEMNWSHKDLLQADLAHNISPFFGRFVQPSFLQVGSERTPFEQNPQRLNVVKQGPSDGTTPSTINKTLKSVKSATTVRPAPWTPAYPSPRNPPHVTIRHILATQWPTKCPPNDRMINAIVDNFTNPSVGKCGQPSSWKHAASLMYTTVGDGSWLDNV